MDDAFVIAITGLPASGKTTIARELLLLLHENYNIRVVHLESDALRRVFTPQPNYSKAERDWFYSVLQFLAHTICSSGIPVIVDATANRRSYRNSLRDSVSRFLLVYVRCPLEVCTQRDPKGIYSRASRGEASTVPGLQEPYEEPLHPDILVESDRTAPAVAARQIIAELQRRRWLQAGCEL